MKKNLKISYLIWKLSGNNWKNYYRLYVECRMNGTTNECQNTFLNSSMTSSFYIRTCIQTHQKGLVNNDEARFSSLSHWNFILFLANYVSRNFNSKLCNVVCSNKMFEMENFLRTNWKWKRSYVCISKFPCSSFVETKGFDQCSSFVAHV